jgi:hypothetical protein
MKSWVCDPALLFTPILFWGCATKSIAPDSSRLEDDRADASHVLIYVLHHEGKRDPTPLNLGVGVPWFHEVFLLPDRSYMVFRIPADTRSINFGLTSWEKTLEPGRTYYLLVRNTVSIERGQVNVSTDVTELFPFDARQLLRLMKRVRPSSWSTPGPVSADSANIASNARPTVNPEHLVGSASQ